MYVICFHRGGRVVGGGGGRMSHLVSESYEATSVLQEEGESDTRFQGTDLLGNRRSHGGILHSR